MVKILTSNDEEIEISKEYIPYLKTIKNMVDDLGDDNLNCIPLTITLDQWNIAKTFLDIYTTELPTDAENMLVDKTSDDLLELWQICNHLDFGILMSAVRDILASRLENMTPDEIRRTIMIEYTSVSDDLKNQIEQKIGWFKNSRQHGSPNQSTAIILEQPPETSEPSDIYENMYETPLELH